MTNRSLRFLGRHKPQWGVRVWLVLGGWRHGELATSPVSGLSGVGGWGGMISDLLFVAFSAGGLRVSPWQRCLVCSICCCMVVSS